MLGVVELSQEGALLADTFGVRLLSYLCATDEDRVSRRLEGGTSLDVPQEEVLGVLLGFARHFAAVTSESGLPTAMQLEVLGEFDEKTQTSVGNALRLHAGGDIDIEIPGDPVLAPLTSLLRDVYPVMLARPEPTFFRQLHLSRALWNSPHRKSFEDGVLNDPDLSRLFVEETESGGWSSMVYRSTGSGGSVQLWSLPGILLTGVWWYGQLANDYEKGLLATELMRLVKLLCRAARGEPCQVPVFVAFAGSVPEGVDPIELPFGTLRPMRESERGLIPPSLEGSVSHTSADGDTVTGSYAGDLVLETTVPYRIKVEPSDFDALKEWPVEMRDYEVLESNLDSLRLASLLATDSDALPMLAPTWRMVFDPLSWGPLQSWSDPRTGPSIAPRRLGPTATKELTKWTTAVCEHRQPNFDVAVRRTISASVSRVDQVDSLVDLVIVWENLFGSRKGEPTLRISAALGWLLGSSPQEREEYRARVTRIYAVRSDIVHGNRLVPPQEASQVLTGARAITLAALRRLFSVRSDLLSMKNGDARSRALIMGG